jgi:hypothetical protein
MTDDNIVNLSDARFPVGSKAWHKELHVCFVVESFGALRKIKSVALGREDIVWIFECVHVMDLQKILSVDKRGPVC